MANLDGILKRRDITLPTKVRLVKAMVFPVIMYGCASWNVKKAEHRRIDAFEYAVYVGHSFSSKEQVSFNFMAAVTICRDIGGQENKVSHCFHCFPLYLP